MLANHSQIDISYYIETLINMYKKNWIAMAVLRISETVTSFTVEVAFGDAIGINSAVIASSLPKSNLFAKSTFRAKYKRIAPIKTATIETNTPPLGVFLKKKSPIAPPKK